MWIILPRPFHWSVGFVSRKSDPRCISLTSTPSNSDMGRRAVGAHSLPNECFLSVSSFASVAFSSYQLSSWWLLGWRCWLPASRNKTEAEGERNKSAWALGRRSLIQPREHPQPSPQHPMPPGLPIPQVPNRKPCLVPARSPCAGWSMALSDKFLGFCSSVTSYSMPSSLLALPGVCSPLVPSQVILVGSCEHHYAGLRGSGV